MGIVNVLWKSLNKVDNTADKDKSVKYSSISNTITETKILDTNIITYLDDNANIHKSNNNEEVNIYRFYITESENTGSDIDIYSTKYHLPVIDNHIICFSIDGTNRFTRVIDLDIRSNDIYTRANINGVWSTWNKILDSYNFSEYAAKKDHNHNTSITDWNTAITSGFYHSAAGASNAPVSDVAITGNAFATGNMIAQTVYPESTDNTELISYTRKGTKNNDDITWGEWFKTTFEDSDNNLVTLSSSSFSNLIQKQKITTIVFSKILAPFSLKLQSSTIGYDVSVAQDSSVMAWIDESDSSILVVSSQGKQKIAFTDAKNMFSECGGKLTTIDFDNVDTSNVTDMSYMFSGTVWITTLKNIKKINTSNVTDMSYMFQSSIIKSIDLHTFDLSNVTNMSYMFQCCAYLTDFSFFTLPYNDDNIPSKITEMQFMFYGCTSLATVDDFYCIDTSNVINVRCMFQKCSSLTELDLSSWNTSNLAYTSDMFNGCSSLTELDLSSWNTSNVLSLKSFVYGCTKLTSINVSNWDTSNTISFAGAFSQCPALTTIDISSWDTNKSTSKTYNFSGFVTGDTALTTFKVGARFNSISTLGDMGFEGIWKDETGTTYSVENDDKFPANVAHTYTKVS